MYTCSIHKIPSSSFHSNFTQKNIRGAGLSHCSAVAAAVEE